MTEQAKEGSREERVNAILAAWLDAAAAGQAPDQAELLDRHPDLAAELVSFFAKDEQVRRLAEPLRSAAGGAETGATTPAETPADPALGVMRYFGDYELVEEIARGGMGAVYKARQISLNRIVALKMILAGQDASAAEVARFRAEAEAVANLDHPHIVPIYEIGEHQGQHFFSMKFVEGQNLAAVLPELVQNPKRAARLLATVAQAVHFAHQRGILHRDLKPANVLLEGDRPYITDFGLAKRTAGDSHLTQTGVIVGTPSYMAPEQARAEKVLTVAVDVYALGAILYECLTGRPPFRAATALGTLVMVMEQEPVRPRSLNPAVDRDLEVIALSCLDKDPRKRYPSAEALAEDLQRWLHGEPIAARQATSLQRLVKWIRRRPAIAALLAAVVVLAVCGVSGILWQWSEAVTARGAAEAALEQARRQQQETSRQLLRAETAHYAIQLNQAERDLEQGKTESARETLTACEPALRGWEHAYLMSRVDAQMRKIDWQGACPCSRSALCPAGDLLALGGKDGIVRLIDPRTGKEVRRLDRHTDTLTFLTFSPDGTRLTVISNAWPRGGADQEQVRWTVQVWDAHGGKLLWSQVGRAAANPLRGAAFTPDGNRLLTLGGAHRVQLWDAHTGIEQPVMALEPEGPFTSAAFSPDGKSLALGTEEHTVILCQYPAGKEVRRFRTGQRDGGGAVGVAFSRDGSLLAGASDDQATVWDLRTDTKRHTLRSPVRGVGPGASAVFSPSGQYLAATVGTWFRVWDLTTGKDVLSRTFADTVGLWPTADGEHVLAVGERGDLTRWLVAPAEHGRLLPVQSLRAVERPPVNPRDRRKPAREIAPKTLSVDGLAFDPRGRYLASVSAGGCVQLWSTVTNNVVRTVGTEGTLHWGGCDGLNAISLAFSPDGRRLAVGVETVDKKKRPKGQREMKGGGVLWDLTTRQSVPIAVTDKQPVEGKRLRTWCVTSLAFSPDGKSLAVGLREQREQKEEVRLLDGRIGKELRTFAGWAGDGVAFSPDGRLLVAAGGRLLPGKPGDFKEEGIVRVWDLESGKEIVSLHPDASVQSVCFSGNGRWMAASTNADVKLYDVAKWAVVATFGAGGHTVAFSPDDKRLIVGTGSLDWGGEASIHDVDTGRRLLTLRGQDAPNGIISPQGCLAVSPDGRQLAMPAKGGTIKVWEAPPKP